MNESIETTVQQLQELIERLDRQIEKTKTPSLMSAKAAAQVELNYWQRCLPKRA